MSSGVSAGAMVSPSDGAIHPLTFESMVIRRATSNEVSAELLDELARAVVERPDGVLALRRDREPPRVRRAGRAERRASRDRCPSRSSGRPCSVYSLILTTVRDFVVALGRTIPETVNGTSTTGAAESFGLLTV